MSAGLRATVRSLGLVGPGFTDWPSGAAVLSRRAPYVAARTTIPSPSLLSAAERRRAGRVLRLAVAAAHEAAGDDAAALPAVFSSSGADGDNCHELCLSLATPARAVSPTRFMNSVHNAAAGYWSLAAHSMRPSTAICAHDGSFAAGLIEAITQSRSWGGPVLLVAYDLDYPEPLRTVRPLPDGFATALVLDAAPDVAGLARIEASLVSGEPTAMDDPALEALRESIPAARSLPLLARLATPSERSDCVLDYLDDLALRVHVAPC